MTEAEHRDWWEANTTVPYGSCWCGCGRATDLAPQTDRRRNWIKDLPVRCLRGHNVPFMDATEYRRQWAESTSFPYGQCWCGCGQKTSVATSNRKQGGWVSGEPKRFLRGHTSDNTTPESRAEYRRWWEANAPVPYGYCWCGCGQKTSPAPQSHTKTNKVKGEPVRFVYTHQISGSRGKRDLARIAALTVEYRARWQGRRPNVPYGLCWCGCGQNTPLSKQSTSEKGWVKGEPIKYVYGHQGQSATVMANEPNPSGLCMCGCGEKTNLSPQTITSQGIVKGKPVRFLSGHSSIIPRWNCPEYEVQDRGYSSPCWIWLRSKTDSGYGQFMVNYQHYLAHRYHYEQAKGPIPDGYHVDHLCVSRTKGRGGSRACCNPEHLEAVPPIVNNRRAQSHKLDSAKAREIKRLKKGGATNVELAVRFGVDAGTIKNVLKGRTWREADEPPSRGELVRALNVLLDGGLLTQEEFEAKGLDLLDRA